MSLEKVLYTASAEATGGRDGRAISSDGVLDVALTTPKALGGSGGEGTNPGSAADRHGAPGLPLLQRDPRQYRRHADTGRLNPGLVGRPKHHHQHALLVMVVSCRVNSLAKRDTKPGRPATLE